MEETMKNVAIVEKTGGGANEIGLGENVYGPF